MNDIYEYRWWRMHPSQPWEPVRVKGTPPDETVKFIGGSKWVWKSFMGGEWGPIIPKYEGENDE